MTSERSESGRRVLRAVCDTFFPALPEHDDPHGFWQRKASDLLVDQLIEAYLSANVPEAVQAGLDALLAALAASGIMEADQQGREQVLRYVAASSPQAEAGLDVFRQLTLLMAYGAPDQHGRNPNWALLGYPGPISPPPDEPKPIQPLIPDGQRYSLQADVCIVGSGAGGGVIAGTLAASGLSVVVLEAGGYYNEADFNQLELWAYQHLYYRGGYFPCADGHVTLVAGATLGGGTTVNWMNCLRTRPDVLAQWAREYGLPGVDAPEYERHFAAVLARISANDRCSDLNGPHLRLKEGCAALGYNFKPIVRNADPTRYDPASAGYLGFGDQTGSKQGTARTYLLDAYRQGARLVVNCKANRILVEKGRAAGVEAMYTDTMGRQVRVEVRAPRVVVAGGSLESPALLLRSGLGGPAVGQYLHLHPVSLAIGLYAEDQQAWWGAPQSALCDQFADTGEGYGFIIEGVQYGPGLLASGIPWQSGRQHKELMSRLRSASTLIAVTRDRGYGRVSIDESGAAVPTYPISDELDRRHLHLGLAEIIRIHAAAGAQEIHCAVRAGLAWKRGQDLQAFIQQALAFPPGAHGHAIYSAHQMGTCRMGEKRATSVANPWGELHDTPGVWIGDGSALPSAPGTNPMISIMALARRTAQAIAVS
ncbi:MAG TPA: GMC family oxidoreductase [Ktedonobacteraceae bacterium]|jgi:choline dehydrogenase-like flavoprotein